MGEVFKARQQKLGNIVAIKLLYRDRLSDRELLDRFEQEMLAVGGKLHVGDSVLMPGDRSSQLAGVRLDEMNLASVGLSALAERE